MISFVALSMGGYFSAHAQGGYQLDQVGHDLQVEGEGQVQIFHKIKKPNGETAGWLLGTQHLACVEKDSFPPEINQAMDQADIGLTELKISDSKSPDISHLLYLPEGTTLPDLMGEQKTKEIFDFIHHSLREELIKKGVEMYLLQAESITIFDILNYSNFIHLSPKVVWPVLMLVYHLRGREFSHEKSTLKRYYFMIEDHNNKQRSLREILSHDLVSGGNQEEPPLFVFDCSYTPILKDLHIEERFVCSGRLPTVLKLLKVK